MQPPLLSVRHLTVRMLVDVSHKIFPVKEVSFEVNAGEIVAVLGESGAGKTTLAYALLRLLQPAGQIVHGSIEFEGRSLLSLSEHELRKVRGARISLIYQDSTVLNPVMRVGSQLVEILRAHFPWNPRRCRDQAIALLEEVELGDAGRIFAAYPHQLSGGQRQRVVIAQALACRPALVIADEPTASLDSGTSREIVELLGRLKRRFQIAILLISHDLGAVEKLADRIMIMYVGRIVEMGPRDDVLDRPLHPYTRTLLACALRGPMANRAETGKRLVPTIPGNSPNPMCSTVGCNFESRCQDRMGICNSRIPAEIAAYDGHTVCCFKFGG